MDGVQIKATTLGEVIRSLRRERGLSQKKLARMLGIDRASIAHWESGRYFPRPHHLEKLASIFGVSPAVFFAYTDEFREHARIGEDAGLWLPVISYVHAGLGVLSNPEELLSVSVDEARKAHFALKVKGKSMEPTLMEGDYVGVRLQEVATTGDIVIAQIDEFDEVTIKRLKQIASEITLVPDNPEFPSYSSRQHRIRIIGKVVWLKRRYEK